MNYYVRIGRKAFGPFPEDEVRKLIAQDRINKSSQISVNGMTWRTAGEYPEFFPPVEEVKSAISEETIDPFASAWNSPFAQTDDIQNFASVNEPKIWYISRDGRSGQGPYTTQTIIDMLRLQQLTPENYIWKQGEQARLFSQEPFFQMFLPKKRESDKKLPFWKSDAETPEGKKISKTYTAYMFSYLCTLLPLILGVLFLILGLACENRNLFVTGVVFLVMASIGSVVVCIISLILHFLFWKAVQPFDARTTPGKAVGFLFIPYFNLYWIFVSYCSLARDMNRALADQNSEKKVNEGLALTYAILLLIPGLPLVAEYIIRPLLNASYRHAALELTEK